jgi:prefoldin subunit 5
MSLEKAKELLEKEVRPALWYALEKNPKMASELLSRMFEEVIAVITKVDQDLSQRISELTENVNKLSKRVDDINTQLSQRISELTENVNKLSKNVSALASTVGRLNRRYAKLEEVELRQTLRDLCFNRGFEADRGFIAKGKPAVDVIITGRKTVALVEIAMRGGSKDIRQLLMASKAYEEIYNVRPNILFLLCVEEPDELTVKRAEKKGVVVTMRPGEIVRTMEKIEKSS